MFHTEINNTLKTINTGGLILYPTDTVWGIGCDATDSAAVKKIFDLKGRDDNKALICLVCDAEMLKTFVKDVPEVTYSILKAAKKPTTIIYDNPMNLAKNLIGQDNTIAIRIIKEGFAHDLIKKLNTPLVSTSANISGKPTPKSFEEISLDILKGVDYVVNLHHEKTNPKPSTIIKLNSKGEVRIIRE